MGAEAEPQQTVFEGKALHDCLAFEIGDVARLPALLEPVQEGIEAVYDAIQSGDYSFGRGDRLCVDLVERFADEIPVHSLLKQINETGRRGLEVDDDA
jgi:hypothetical protein